MGRAWDNSAIHRRLLSGVSETDKPQSHGVFKIINHMSAKPLDWRDLQPFGIRWTTLRALGLQLPETAAAGACFFTKEQGNSGLGSTRAPHIVRALCHGVDLHGPVQNARRTGCAHGTVQHAHFVHGGSLDVGDVLHEGRCRIQLRLVLVVHAVLGVPRVRGQPHETTEHPVHAFSMKLQRKSTLTAASGVDKYAYPLLAGDRCSLPTQTNDVVATV